MILAIDCGLSSVKVALATREGRILAAEREPYPTRFDGERAEQLPTDWWDALAAACARLPGRQDVQAVICTGHMHATLLIDERGEPLLPCLTLHDRRGADLLRTIDTTEYHAATGQVLDGALPLAKLLWLNREDPSLLRRAVALLAPKDYLRFRLTGTLATDPIDAAGTGLYDPTNSCWSRDALSWAAVPPELLVPVAAPTATAGTITEAAAATLGITGRSVVLVGAGDDIELLGAAAHDDRAAVEHVGTTGAIFRATNGLPTTLSPRCELSPTATAGTFAISASTANVGSVFVWIRERLGLDPADALTSDPLLSDPTALPYLLAERALGSQAAGHAAIVHLDTHHGRHEIARAMLCAVALSLHDLLDEVEDVSGPIKTLYTSGGVQDPQWLRLRASAYGRPLNTLTNDATTLGCIALAQSALGGRREPIEQLAAELRRTKSRVDPDPSLRPLLAALRERQHEVRHKLERHRQPRAALV